MKQILLLVLLALFLVSSCSKDDNENNLNGIFIETSPVEGRTTLEFQENIVTVLKQGGSKDRFEYQISGEKILLTPSWDKTISTEHSFEKVNNNQIKIGNLYPTLYNSPDMMITFERK